MGQYVFVDRLPEQRTPAACRALKPRSKLLSKTVVSFQIIWTTPDTITIDKDGIHNIEFIDRVTRALFQNDRKNQTDKRNNQKNLRNHSCFRLSRNDSTDKAKYPVEKIVRRITAGDNVW